MSNADGAPGIDIQRHFTRDFAGDGQSVWDSAKWQKRTARIEGEGGEVVFEQRDVHVPEDWSALATNIVASKYFRGPMDTPERETSVRQLIGRVVDTITGWGREGGYFADAEQERCFSDELTYLLLHQKACFNSPVWFNLGVTEPDGTPVPQQASACFINSVEDTMRSIMDLAKTEAMLFKGGSGTGTNLSTIRSSREGLTGGGIASGPVSFMKGFDSFAGVIRSGGKTRRAAKMVILNSDHGDVLDFVRSKAEEEKKAWALIEQGYNGQFNVPGGAYESVQYQNANHSVRVTDGFMKAVETGGTWQTKATTSGEVLDTLQAGDLMHEIAEAAHLCGDPGLQYDTTINRWNPVKNTGRINATNPCAEFIFLDDTACNLASINLLAFADEDGRFQTDDFKQSVDVLILAMEIIVGFADYPTPRIAKNSFALRPLGLGYANLGAFLMLNGLAYDSDEGRNLAAAITSLMSGRAYRRSAEISARVGAFSEYEPNRKPFLEVIGLHREYAAKVDAAGVPGDLHAAARQNWTDALELGRQFGYRNGQVTVLAPTGTIAFMMDCDTTGIEPDIALVKYKQLVGGGMLKIVNRTLPGALRNRGYDEDAIAEIVRFVDEHDTIEGAPGLQDEDLSIFDCAFPAAHGRRSIRYMGHIEMMAATQPFLSGGISKTVNMPADSTVEDVVEAYRVGWEKGLKCLAIYRDGSKRSQPLSTRSGDTAEEERAPAADAELRRRRLPDERAARTHKFSIAGHEGYITVGMYDDGSPGEVFLRMSKEGSTISGLMDTVAVQTSIALQYGVPLKALVDKFAHTRYEPSGFTQNPEIPIAKSVTDYVFRWLGLNFLGADERPVPAVLPQAEDAADSRGEERLVPIRGGSQAEPSATPGAAGSWGAQEDAPPCSNCGTMMVRAGACYCCPSCGETGGCG
ncbi:MAG: vitamin B12-dependent ribonucleotide reductase [Deltaproteobacteria bacterium]|nr:vitamin B12-dependent ribonucleotide reductase [Deltaproteobacteria bacterium]MBW2415078.1 vitamin B12-dependent ribonucleotide reductase [Deltaproteobacteria bacterium]